MSTTPVNIVQYWIKQAFESVTEKTSRNGLFIGVEGVVFYMRAIDEPAIYRIDVRIDEDDDWAELAEGTAKAGELTVVEVGFLVPEARLRVTPSAVPMKFSAKAYGYPAVYTRLLNDDRPCRQDPAV